MNFPDVHTVVKSLRLSRLGRFLNCTNESWQAIPNSYFNNSEMLDYFKEVRSGYPDVYNSEFILWNNREITIESKSIFWKCLFDKGIIMYRIYLIETVSSYQ